MGTVWSQKLQSFRTLMEETIMLVLTRTSGQEIVIDGGIRLTVLDVQGNRVRLGISAPAEVTVVREEIRGRKSDGCRPHDQG